MKSNNLVNIDLDMRKNCAKWSWKVSNFLRGVFTMNEIWDRNKAINGTKTFWFSMA